MEASSIINALFNKNYYLTTNADVRHEAAIVAEPTENGVASVFNPLTHFLQFGQWEGRDPSALFSQSYYLAHNKDVADAKVNAFQHYITYGEKEGRAATPFFDSKYYLAQNPDVAQANINPFEHFITYGEKEGRNPAQFFDKNYYLAQNKDVVNAHIDAFQHYMEYGQFENRAPNANFNAVSYLTLNLDVASAVKNGNFASAIEHYLLFGKAEGRIVTSSGKKNDNNNHNNDEDTGNNNNNNGNDNNNNGGNDTDNNTASPVNTIPGQYSIEDGDFLELTGLSVADSDSTTLTVTFTATHGILIADDAVENGIDAAHITGNNTAQLVLTGTIAAINATLAAQGGISFSADDGYEGQASITMVSSDGTHTDTDAATVTITVDHSTTMLLTADSDNLVAEDGSVIFSTSQAFFDESDTLTGSSDQDTLLFTDTCDITLDNLANKTAIDIIKLSADNNNIMFSDAFVESSDQGVVEINNRNFTVTYLDTSDVSSPNIVIIGGTGAVTLADDVNNSITSKDDVNTYIIDGTGDDTILGGTGDDTIVLMGGDNSINGGGGDDTISVDIDTLNLGTTIDGGDGIDTLLSVDLVDITPDMLISSIEIISLSSDDSHITLSNDFVSSAEDATVILDNGNFTISYLDTSDLDEDSRVVVKGSGTVILADDFANTVYAGNDVGASIIGGTGDDTIIGGEQDDTLSGGEGADILTGGAGADYFVFTSLSDSFSDTPDIIIDFNSVEDVISLEGLGFDGIIAGEDPVAGMLTFTNDGENTVIVDSSGNFRIILSGVITDLSSDNVIF